MKNSETSNTSEQKIPTAENQRGIKNHQKAAAHYEAAAKSHLEAAGHHEKENHEKAARSTVEAHGHSSLGNEAQKEDVKHHTEKM